MPHRKHSHQLQKGPAGSGVMATGFAMPGEGKRTLDVVLKCDSTGSVEAISASLAKLRSPEADVKLIHAGVGAVTKQDLLMALTGSKLVLGFEVGVAPKLEQWVKEHGVEVRLYNVIYKLIEDLGEIIRNLVPAEPEETITGKCKVIATFKSSKGVILGCEVREGAVQVGKNFRIVAAMGPVHSSRIESLQVDKNPVKEARQGQQVGVKVAGYTGAKEGDYIECFETTSARKATWSPEGRIVHLETS
ncbi:MAG: hypothetical protein WAW37_04255 [Syntrophobacteraceae bacterium]